MQTSLEQEGTESTKLWLPAWAGLGGRVHYGNMIGRSCLIATAQSSNRHSNRFAPFASRKQS